MKSNNTLNAEQINGQQSQIPQRTQSMHESSALQQQNRLFNSYDKTTKSEENSQQDRNHANPSTCFQANQKIGKKISTIDNIFLIKSRVNHIKDKIQGSKIEQFKLGKENVENILEQCNQIIYQLTQLAQYQETNKAQKVKFLEKNEEGKVQYLKKQIKSLKRQNLMMKMQDQKLRKQKQCIYQQLKQIENCYQQVNQLKHQNDQYFQKEKARFIGKQNRLQQMIEKLLIINRSKTSNISYRISQSQQAYNNLNQNEVVSQISHQFYAIFKSRPNSQILPKECQSSFQQSSILGMSINSICQSQKIKKSPHGKYHSGVLNKAPIIEQQSPRSSILSNLEKQDKDRKDIYLSNGSDNYQTFLEDYSYLKKTS